MRMTRKMRIALIAVLMVGGLAGYISYQSHLTAKANALQRAEWNWLADQWCENSRYKLEACRGAVLFKLFIGFKGEKARALAMESLAEIFPDVSADPIAARSTGELLEGKWRLTEFRSAGIYSGGAEDDARALIGSTLSIHGRTVSFPDGSMCQMESLLRDRLDDSTAGFGAGGHSWRDLGLIPSSDRTYRVSKIDFDCPEKFRGLLVQTQTGVHLLRVWEVYLVMQRT